ncbi:MAG: PilZ domain-containing protein [Myxococcota bacterium]
MGFEDKRRSQRYDAQLALRVTRGDDTVVGMTQNVSLGGVMASVPLEPVPALGERLQLSFSIPQLDAPIEVEAEVRWAAESGLGLQFMTGLRAKQTWALGRFLESLAS